MMGWRKEQLTQSGSVHQCGVNLQAYRDAIDIFKSYILCYWKCRYSLKGYSHCFCWSI